MGPGPAARLVTRFGAGRGGAARGETGSHVREPVRHAHERGEARAPRALRTRRASPRAPPASNTRHLLDMRLLCKQYIHFTLHRTKIMSQGSKIESRYTLPFTCTQLDSLQVMT